MLSNLYLPCSHLPERFLSKLIFHPNNQNIMCESILIFDSLYHVPTYCQILLSLKAQWVNAKSGLESTVEI